MSKLKRVFLFIHQFSTLQFCDDEAASLLLRLHRIRSFRERRRCCTLHWFTFQSKCKFTFSFFCGKLICYVSSNYHYNDRFFSVSSTVAKLLWKFIKMFCSLDNLLIIYIWKQLFLAWVL